MVDEWPNEYENSEIDFLLNRVSLSRLIFSSVRKEFAENMVELMNFQWQRRMKAWLPGFHQHLGPNLNEIETVLKSKLEDFAVVLRGVQKSTVDAPESLLLDQVLKKKVNQLLIDAFSQDPGQEHELFIEKGSDVRIFYRLFGTLPMLFPHPWFVGLFLAILMSILQGRAGLSSRLNHELRHELRGNIANSMPTMLSNIRTSISDAWRLSADKLSIHLEAYIDQVKSQLNDALDTRREGEAVIAAEMSDLSVIKIDLDESFERLSQVIYGRVLTLEELQRLVED